MAYNGLSPLCLHGVFLHKLYIHIRCEERRQNCWRKTPNSKTHLVQTSKDKRNCPHYEDVGIQKVWMGAGGGGVLARLLHKIPALG